MKIVAIADTHDQHRRIKIPPCDVFIHAGDFTCHREPRRHKYDDFNQWLSEIPAKYKIVVAGNHDVLMEKEPRVITNAIYLCQSGTNIDGINFWGSPYQLPCDNWAFGKPEIDLKHFYWDMHPKTDVLITHCPPYGILDYEKGQHIGSKNLRRAVSYLPAKLHIFGHAHCNYGAVLGDKTLYVNCSQVWLGNVPRHQPFIIEV